MQARRQISETIAREGGWVSFARYMQLALHEPGIGYYASGARKFGAEGDFVTAPELGSLFGRTLARELRAFDRVLERGAGRSAPAEVLPEGRGYLIWKTSADLLGQKKEGRAPRARHIDRLPERY